MGTSTATAKSKGKYPLGYWICCLTYSFERFAFYGSKPFLILFLTTAVSEGGLGMSDTAAAPLAANLTAFTYIAPIVGGFICDRWLGARYGVTLGCILMGVSYLFGWQAYSVSMVNAMIIVLSIGTAFFKGNLAALIGRMFDDPEILDSAFSIQYAFVNVGAFLGSLICGVLYMSTFKQGDVLGFRQQFLVCGVLVLIGGALFTLSYPFLKGQGRKPFKYQTDTEGNVIGVHEAEKGEKSTAPLTKQEKNGTIAIIIVSLFSIIFWLAYYQQDIALTLYMRDYANMEIFGFTLSEGHVTTTWNGLLCIFLSLIFAKIWESLSKRPQGDMSMFRKIGFSFFFMAMAYAVLMLAEITRGIGAGKDSQISVVWCLGFGALLTVGEIFFSPLGNSFVSKHAPKKYLSLLMGVWTFATFAATKINGYFMAVVEKMGYFSIFVVFAVVCVIIGVCIFAGTKKLEQLTNGQ